MWNKNNINIIPIFINKLWHGFSHFLEINDKEQIVRDCLSGSNFEDEECVKDSTAIGVIPTDFCVCTSDLCNGVPNRPIQIPFYLVLISSAISLIVNA